MPMQRQQSMKPLLAESFEKLRRAEHHAADLTRQIDQWKTNRSQTLLPFTGEFEDQQSRFVYRMGNIRQDLPIDWPLIIGDALTNYRAALDYLTWQLTAIHPSPQRVKETLIQFPLIWEWPRHKTGQDRFIADLPNRLPGLDAASPYVKIIENHQPYQWAGHDASLRDESVNDYFAAQVGRVERHPLALLDRLSNHDKHRQLQVVEELPVHVSAEVVDYVDCEVLSMVPIERKRLDPGAEVLHVYVRRLNANKPTVKVSLSLDIVPAFDASIAVHPALEIGLALEVIGREVRSVLDEVDALLP